MADTKVANAVDPEALKLVLIGISQIRDIVKKQESVQSDEIKAHLMNELPKAVKPVIQAIKSIKIPEVKIPPQKDIKFPEFPTIPEAKEEVTVKNISEIGRYFENLEETIRTHFNVPAPTVNVSPPRVDVKAPIVNVDAPNLDNIIKSLKPLKFLSNKAATPLSVRMSDGKNFVKAMKEVAQAQERTVQAFSQQRSMNVKEYRSSYRALTQKDSATNTKISVLATTTAVVTATTGRISLTLVNDSDEPIYISKSATAVMNEGIRLNASGGSVSIEDYIGAVSAICTSGTKNLTVCEV